MPWNIGPVLELKTKKLKLYLILIIKMQIVFTLIFS